jgi:hypothetical protein
MTVKVKHCLLQGDYKDRRVGFLDSTKETTAAKNRTNN